VQAAGLSRRQEASFAPPFVKLLLLTNTYVEKTYLNAVFAKVQNQRLAFIRDIENALARCDVLVTPTTPRTAPLLPEGPMSELEQLQRLSDASVQWPFTQAFNLSTHPALAIPNGADADDLPTSIQIVGRKFDEFEVFRTGFALERLLRA
jgi:amidase